MSKKGFIMNERNHLSYKKAGNFFYNQLRKNNKTKKVEDISSYLNSVLKNA